MSEIIKKLTDEIKNGADSHRSVPFWSWNDELEEEELRRQIRNMKDLGMGGFFMHARGGLETEYMSDRWFDCINACIDEAKKQGMAAWSYDENGWPSGFAGGELLSDKSNQACGLVLKYERSYPAESEDLIGVYVNENNEIKKVRSDYASGEYIAIYRERDFSYVDTMNEAVTQKFIEKTHEKYKEKIDSEDFGTVMPGFFTDEPQYFRYGTPWSDTFFTKFGDMFGYDVLSKLPLLFIEANGYREFRYDYHLLCHLSFYGGFMKPIYDWCDKNGVQLTGHGIEEWSLGGQMICCGGIMPFYLYEHVPGIDYLGRPIKDASGAKQLGSVLAQTGKKYSIAEIFAMCGWDVTPREIKRIAGLLFAGGVNIICEHLYAYSARGQRKRDYPCHYSEHNSWQKYYGEFETHFCNLGSALSIGEEIADTLVIHPIRDAYMYYRKGSNPVFRTLEESFSELTARLTADGILYHFGDETVMTELASVEGNKIRVGKCVYDKVLIPNMETLSGNTVKLLKEYLANGGKLCLYGKAPERIDGRYADLSFLKANISYDEIKAQGVSFENIPLRVMMRRTEYGRLLYVMSTTDREYADVEIKLPSFKGVREIDINTLESRKVRGKRGSDGSLSIVCDFKNADSYLFIESDDEPLPTDSKPEARYFCPSDFVLDSLPENSMTLDRAELSLDGGKYSEQRPIEMIRDNLLRDRFKGDVTLRYSFDTDYLPKKLIAVVEPSRYKSVAVNGKQVPLSNEYRIDRRFKSVELTDKVKLGHNEIELTVDYYQSEKVYKVMYGGGNEALRNCLSFDTELEAIYLYGDFNVTGSFTEEEPNMYRSTGAFKMTCRKNSIDLTDIVRDGYTFFSGEISARSEFEWKKGMPTALRLGGRFACYKVNINGTQLDARLFTDIEELKPYLKEGKNTLILTLCISNRNLLGPHHCKELETLWVGPDSFSFEKKWDGCNCDSFVHDYSFIREGISF